MTTGSPVIITIDIIHMVKHENKRNNRQTDRHENQHWLIDWLSMVLRLHQHNMVVIRPTVFTGLMTQPTVSKHWRRVVSHPDRPQSNQAHLTVLQYYNMHENQQLEQLESF